MTVLFALNVLINIYWICLLLGFIWLAVQVFLADFGHDFSSADVGLPHGDMHIEGGHDGGHGSGSEGSYGAEVNLSPVSPMIISGFITIFGATGILLQNLTKLNMGISVLLAIAAGFIGGAILWAILNTIIRAVSGTSEARIAELIGKEAEVITPIRGSSVGEIAYVAGGSRYNAPAKSLDNSVIDRNKIVKIIKIVGTTYFVKEVKPEESQTKSETS